MKQKKKSLKFDFTREPSGTSFVLLLETSEFAGTFCRELCVLLTNTLGGSGAGLEYLSDSEPLDTFYIPATMNSCTTAGRGNRFNMVALFFKTLEGAKEALKRWNDENYQSDLKKKFKDKYPFEVLSSKIIKYTVVKTVEDIE